MKCKLWFCEGKHYAKGYCKTHWANLRRYGTPIAPGNRDLRNAIKKVEQLSEKISDDYPTEVSLDLLQVASRILEIRDQITEDELIASRK